MTAALEIQGLTKRYGSVVAVSDLHLSVPEGSLFGLIGPNGAGKTTTFSVLAGFLRPDAGTIRIFGETIPFGVPRAGKLAVLPQDAGLLPRSRVLDALVTLGRLGGKDKHQAKERARDCLHRLGLGEVVERRIDTLSHGQRRRVAIAQTLLGDREIVVLDEPTSGLDPLAAAELRNFICDLQKTRTIVLSSHNLSEVEALCDHAAILSKGRLVASGSMRDLLRQTSRVRLNLVAAPSDAEMIKQRILSVPGIESAEFAADNPRAFDVVVAQDAAVDASVNTVVGILLGLGVGLHSMDRGQSLEERFLEETKNPE